MSAMTTDVSRIKIDRTHALYFQETYRVGRDGGETLSGVPIKWYHGGEDSF